MNASDVVATLIREKDREGRLGEGPACARCGREEPATLTASDVRLLIEEHHPAREANDPEITVPLCLNCHALVHEGIRRLGLNRGEPTTFLRKLSNTLVLVGQLLTDLGEQLVAKGRKLRKLIPLLPDGWQEAEDDLPDFP